MKIINLILYVFICFYLLQFTACKQNENKHTLIIDSLKSELANAAKIIANINDDKNNELSLVVDSNLNYFSNNFKDTITKPIGFMFQEYKIISKEIKKYNQIKDQLKLNIDYTINQLEKLKADFFSGKITNEQFQDFLLVEKKESIKLIDIAKERGKMLNNKYRIFDSLNPLIINFNKKLKLK